MINDIFSKEPIPTISQNPIIIDHRERNSLVPSELIGIGHKIIFKQLKVGDYIINDTVIERKEINDLIHSIKNKRLFQQLEEIKQFQNYILIIEGTIYNQKKLHPNAIRGAILSAATSYKIPIIFTQHHKETSQYLSILRNKENKKNTEIKTPIKKHFNKKSLQINILESFPNIGNITAQKLLNKFKTLKKTINATEEEIKPILGKNAKTFLKILE